MKTLFIICSLITQNTNSAFSQNAFPLFNNNPTWNVYHSFYGTNTWTEIYQYSYDTVFCGYQYSKIDVSPPFMWTGHGFVRTDNDKVYVRLNNNCLDKEFLMYDFTMSVGDTVICGYEYGDSTQFWLTQIDTVNYFGIDRQRYRMNFKMGPPGFYTVEPMDWIKGIGSLWHPLYTLVCLNSGCESVYQLICLDSAGNQLYHDPFFTGCDTTFNMSVENILNESSVSIFPNPFNNLININVKMNFPDEIALCLYSTQGKLIEQKYNSHGLINFATEDLPAGIYFLNMHSGNNSYSKKIIKE